MMTFPGRVTGECVPAGSPGPLSSAVFDTINSGMLLERLAGLEVGGTVL